MTALFDPFPPPPYTITIETRGRYHCPNCQHTLDGAAMDHLTIRDAEYAYGHVHFVTSSLAATHMATCTGPNEAR